MKSVTLSRLLGLAEFPDAVTARGTKHLGELAGMVAIGARAVLLYLVQRGDCRRFEIAADIDPVYAAAAQAACAAGVEILVVRAEVTPVGIEIQSDFWQTNRPMLRPEDLPNRCRSQRGINELSLWMEFFKFDICSGGRCNRRPNVKFNPPEPCTWRGAWVYDDENAKPCGFPCQI